MSASFQSSFILQTSSTDKQQVLSYNGGRTTRQQTALTVAVKYELTLYRMVMHGYLQDHILSFPKMYIFGIFIID